MFALVVTRYGRVFLLLLALSAALCFGPPAVRAAETTPAPGPAPSATPSNGLAWRNIGPSAAGGRVAAVAGTDLDPALFYAGAAGGGLWKSTNGAIDWQPVFDAANVASIGAIAITPLNKDDVWVGTGEAWPRNDVIAGSNAAVLFAGTERGVWWSANRGVAWEPFPAHLPPSAVRDLLVQPDAGDLIAGTHGRGVWIFDDLRALEGRANAEATGLSVFPPRDAVLAQRDTPTTDTQAAGTNPEGPAAITFYQRTAATTAPAIDIVDADGHTVRHLAGMHDVDDRSVPVVPNQPGFNRVFWDLCADGPTPWERAPKWNRAPEHGVPVLSGKYTVVLHRDGAALRTTIHVNADRRTIPTDRDELRGHAFLTGLFGELGQIDEALNVLDNLRLQLPARAESLDAAAGDTALATRLRTLAAQSADIERVLTSQPQNSQDDDFLEDLLRERLMTFIGSASRSTPTNEQVREAAALARETNAALDRYHVFMAAEIVPLQHELARAGSPLDLAQKPDPDPKPGPNVDERADRRPDADRRPE